MDPTMLGDTVSSWSTKETEDITREAEELRRRDEVEMARRREGARRRIENHLNQHGGDLSLFMKDGIPIDMHCIQLSKWGSNDENVKTARIEVPLPLKNEVLIKSYSCGVLFHDLLTRQGILDSWSRSWKLPFTLGGEVAGEVVGVGRNITQFKPADRVVAFPPRKAWAEYVVCKADQCFIIPDKMTYDDAVALILDGMVAYSLLFEMGGLKIGAPRGLRATPKNVLMHSSAGGLSDMVIQMLRNVPNARLFKIALTDEEFGESSGEMIHHIDRDADYVSEVRRVSPRGVDLILDCQHESNLNRDFDLLKPMGKYVLYGTYAAFSEGRGLLGAAKSWFSTERISPLRLYEENKSVCGFNLRSLLYYHHDREYLCDLFYIVCQLWQEGKILPKIDCILNFDEFPTALHKTEDIGQQKGKIILNPSTIRGYEELPKDYLAQAEKIVRERQREKQAEEESVLPSLRLPKPGELAHDISPEEKAREELEKRQQEQVEAERKLLEENARNTAAQQPVTIPVVLTEGTALPVVTKTLTTGVAPTGAMPSASTPTTINEPKSRPILTREKVELSIPMSKEEADKLMRETPSQIVEPEGDTKIYGELRGE